MITKVFKPVGTNAFSALTEARAWLNECRISTGPLCGDDPVGLIRGDFYIEKWRSLTATEKEALDGTMTSPDFRHGEVTIALNEQ